VKPEPVVKRQLQLYIGSRQAAVQYDIILIIALACRVHIQVFNAKMGVVLLVMIPLEFLLDLSIAKIYCPWATLS